MYSFKDIIKYSKNLSLLYVEDDSTLLEETSDILENFFSEVVTAVDGQEGIDKYIDKKNKEDQFFDIVITDINMPNKDGIAMIKEIKQIHEEQTIIVISAHNESERLLSLIQLGIDNFIMKPIDARHLLQVLHKASKHVFLEKQKDQFLIDQSKLASMGEMIDSIAHQWLQPIHIMKMGSELLNMKIEDGRLDEKEIKKYTEKNIIQLNHLTQTLSEFRNFFKPNDNYTLTTYNKIIDNVLLLLKDTITSNSIDFKIDINSKKRVNIIPNEFKHIIINIITNAIEAFNENGIDENRSIKIKTFDEDDKTLLMISDNAGGIPQNVITKIFEANFTTKKKGSGVGLYLCSKIIEKAKGELRVENTQKGASFIISLKSID